MTDITDQDRRQLRDDAKAVINKTAMRSSAAVSIAQYVLATVEPPAPTLAEELRYRATLLDNGDPDGDTPQALRDLATRAEQMEHDAEDLREWNRNLTKQVSTLTRERAEAHAEVNRLTAEQDTEAPHNHDWLAGMKDATRYAVNATHPDPADVKPGEAWLVECRGERRTAVKDSDDDEPWNTFTAGGLFFPEDNEAITLVSRLVPAPRVITNADELERLAVGSIIRTREDLAMQKKYDGRWYYPESKYGWRPSECADDLPATVLWEPEA